VSDTGRVISLVEARKRFPRRFLNEKLIAFAL
jgi:hypothetical protein